MTPCARCVAEACQCKYEPNRDRRRKAHTAELLSFHAALCRTAAKLRAGTPEEITWLIWKIQSLPTDQQVVSYLVNGY